MSKEKSVQFSVPKASKAGKSSFFEIQKADKKQDYDAFFTTLAAASRVLIATNKPHTADNMCGAIALSQVLKKQGKDVTTIIEGGQNTAYSWLPGVDIIEKSLSGSGDFIIHVQSDAAELERIKYTLDEKGISLYLTPKAGRFNPSDVSFGASHEPFDLIITLGITDLKDLGDLWKSNTALFSQSTILPIVPSGFHPNFGQEKLTIRGSATSSEVVYHLCQSVESFARQIDKELATVLLAGLSSATESFLGAETKPLTFITASKLLALGADHTLSVNKLFKSKSILTLSLWGRILSNLELDLMHKIAWSTITQAELSSLGVSEIDLQNIIDVLMRHTDGAEMAVLFIESIHGVQIQLRASGQSHLFDSLSVSTDYETEKVPHGINIILPNTTLPEIQMAFMRDVAEFQKTRYNLPADLPITKSTIQADFSPKKAVKSIQKTKTTGKMTWKLENLPFGVEEN